jgi:ABC-type amino acid transport substrate-binding protein
MYGTARIVETVRSWLDACAVPIVGRSCHATRGRLQWMRPRVVALAMLLAAVVASPSSADQRVYRIALTFPFPPWDVGPLQGVDFDLLSALCEANQPMHCILEAWPSSACVDTDATGEMIIGPALVSGAVDGCVAWYGTPARKRLGAEFTDGYSHGPLPQLIAADGDTRFDALGADGDLAEASVAFIAGFFNDDACLAAHYSGFSSSFYSSEQSGRDAMIADLLAGARDLAFWDSVATVPAGTHAVGEPVTDCGPLLSMMTYPPSTSRPHQADALRRDFNCGLALIRRSGEMGRICEASTYPGGDPTCVVDGPAPTLQCLQDNPSVAGREAQTRRGRR